MNILKKFWWDGKFLDLWSIPHLLFGIVTILLFNQIGLDLVGGLFLTLLIAFLWEIFEYSKRWHEFLTNSLSDIVVAIIGYTITWLIIIYSHATEQQPLVAFVVVTIIWLGLNFTGWLISRKRK